MRYISALVLLLLLFACDQPQNTAPAVGKVYPSPVYLHHFGEPPVPQQGYAYAQVGFLPLADGSAQVLPIPLFMFNENQHLDRMLSQLFSDRLLVSARNKVRLPYMAGVGLTQLDQAGATLLVYLSLSNPVAAEILAGVERATAETAVQFEEVERVRFFYDGEPSGLQPIEGYQHQPAAIADVMPPTLIDAIASWHSEDKQVEEVRFNFDRPVAIDSFGLLDEKGAPIAGDFYTTMFNMAVVLHPQQPEKFHEGMRLTIAWQAHDQMGRKNAGKESLPLVFSKH